MKKRLYAARRLLEVSVVAAALALRTATATAGDSAAIQNLMAKAAAGDVNAQLSLAQAYATLYAQPGRMHAGFLQFAAFDQDAIDNRASSALARAMPLC